VVPNFEAANARTIYARPPAAREARARDMAPRLTVQIPDSTMDRASKIFQGIYAAHAAALEQVQGQVGSSYGARVEGGSYERGRAAGRHGTSGSSSSSIARTVFETPMGETRLSRFSRENSRGMKGDLRRSDDEMGTTTLKERSQSPGIMKRGSVYLTPISRSQSPAKRNSLLGPSSRSRSQESAKRNSRVMRRSSKRLSSFPVPPMTRIPEPVAVTGGDLSDFESGSEEEEEGSEWEMESVGSMDGRGKIKEPEWEMLTPVSRGIGV